MISMRKSFKVKIPRLKIPFTGKLTQELNKRQTYNRLYKKPQELQRRLPSAKNTEAQLSKLSDE